MTAAAPAPLDTRYELFRIVTDYEALQDGFLDRIEDLETTLEQIDMAGGFAKGNAQKCLTKTASVRGWDRAKRDKRILGWDSLGKMLAGTGLALVLVVDDERFAEQKDKLSKRRRKALPTHAGKIHPKWRFTPKTGRKARAKWWNGLTEAQKKKHQRKAQRGMVAARRRKRLSGALLLPPMPSRSGDANHRTDDPGCSPSNPSAVCQP